MKKVLSLLFFIATSIAVDAQMFRIYKGGKIVYAVSNPDSIVGVPPCDSMETVDLGLPSGTLWATCNIGAQVPEDVGDYYQWGALTPIDRTKDVLGDPEAYIFYYTGDAFDLDKFSKYNETDGKLVLDAEDDVANVLYGEGWCIPSLEQNEELYNNTTISEETINNIPVLRYTANNGNSIVVPKSGYAYYNFGWRATWYNEYAYFWLNHIVKKYEDNTYGYEFGATSGLPVIDATDKADGTRMYYRRWNGTYNGDRAFRVYGVPVRPVYKPSK